MGEDQLRLLADIGGTNVRFALLAHGSDAPQREHSFGCADYSGLEQAARAYLADAGNPRVSEAAIDVATAVTGDVVKLTKVAEVYMGWGFFAVGAYVLLLAAAVSAFDPKSLWHRIEVLRDREGARA